MSEWVDNEAWAGLVGGSTCPICQGIQEQGKPLWVLIEMQASWVTAPPTAPLPGYVCLVSKRHVVEPYQLPAAEQQMWWQDVMVAAEAITELLGSPKMNYEIHGNTIPHLHTHLFPRMMEGDPYMSGPIDPSLVSFTRSQEDLGRLRRAIEAKAERWLE
jgi:diadenosine tetraphosphate (Ap4A) HIT family hydrolase